MRFRRYATAGRQQLKHQFVLVGMLAPLCRVVEHVDRLLDHTRV
jgi:hypothetical protein